ncbi:MAG: hypothetical protein V4739_09515 [Pseudomonadota bacterium]
MSILLISKAGRLARWAVVSVSVACLAACGGGGEDNTVVTSASSDAQTAVAPERVAGRASGDTASQALAALPNPNSGWGQPNEIYKDPTTSRPFTPEQVAVNDKGDVFVTWLSRHQGATALGQTDVWVRQYSAKDDSWLAGKIVAEVPTTEDGRVQDVQLVAAGNDVFAVWEFALVNTVFFPRQPPLLEMVKPGRLYASRLVAGEGNWSAAEPVPGSVARPTGKPNSWKTASVGDQALGVFWYAADGFYLSNVYSTNQSAWAPTTELGESESGVSRFNQFVNFVPVFNRQGAGVVSIFNFAGRNLSVYRDSATGQWSPIPLFVQRTSGLVDEQGNVYSVYKAPNALPGEGAIEMQVYSAATRQVQAPVNIYATSRLFGVQNLNVSRGLQGTVVTWTEETGTLTCPVCWDQATKRTLRRALNVSASGQPVGEVQTLGEATNPATDIQWQRTQPAGPALVSVWNTFCNVFTPGLSVSAEACARDDQVYASERRPNGEWSAPQVLPNALPGGVTSFEFKTNRQGQGVLIQSRVWESAASSTSGQILVYATVLK